ncbi:alpha/beta hydrolase family protein [Akkermansia muciniphila]|nr:alpha/beta hydrolase family protein [Akkermansia muciniphila]
MAIWLHDYSARRFFSLLLASLSLPSFSLTPPSEKFRAADWAVLHSSRSDQRHVSSRGIVQTMLEKLRPACEFSPDMAPKDFPAWREKVRKAMQQLMKFPQADIPAPVLVKTVPREHYRVEKWEAYPFPGAAVPFLVLLPNNASDKDPVPVLFCIPGSDQTKEELAGKHHRIWTSLPYSSRATTPWLSIMSGRDGRPLWWTMPERVKKETRNTPQAVLHTIMKTWPASCWKWTGAGWATPPTRTNVFWIG